MKVDGQVSLVYYQYNAPRRPPMRLAFLIPPMLLLAACGQKDENDRSAGTDISINADGEGGGEVQIPTGKDGGKQIGRAACRERVCQYVEISVVAVSSKKKNIERNRTERKNK